MRKRSTSLEFSSTKVADSEVGVVLATPRATKTSKPYIVDKKILFERIARKKNHQLSATLK